MLKAILESFITSCQYLICNTVCSGRSVRESSLPPVGDDIAVLIIQVGIPIVLMLVANDIPELDLFFPMKAMPGSSC